MSFETQRHSSSSGFLLEGNVIYDIDQSPGSRNDEPVRFNRSKREWQAWIDNTLTIDPQAPPEAAALQERAGLEPAYHHLRELVD